VPANRVYYYGHGCVLLRRHSIPLFSAASLSHRPRRPPHLPTHFKASVCTLHKAFFFLLFAFLLALAGSGRRIVLLHAHYTYYNTRECIYMYILLYYTVYIYYTVYRYIANVLQRIPKIRHEPLKRTDLQRKIIINHCFFF